MAREGEVLRKLRQAPVLKPGQSYAKATDQIAAVALSSQPRFWWYAIAIPFVWALAFMYVVAYVFAVGVGLFGVNIPSAWGFPVTNVVWWIGIGHAGTLISAILLLLHQAWRNSINRFAEAMTIFAIVIAGSWPIIHLGRPWYFYWLIPYPTNFGVWPQFRSALAWDFWAIFTYMTVSVLFWYQGMIPDLATLRDQTDSGWRRLLYGSLALGWRGASRHWKNYEAAYLLLAGLATPLVVSVHSVISLDFAITMVPGYHSTIFPAYFVAGAVYSGFAMALTILIPLRHFYRLGDYITLRHLNNAAKIMLACGLLVVHGYMSEFFTAWYSADPTERELVLYRLTGDYAPAVWTTLICNLLLVQLLWLPQVRASPLTLWILAVVLNVGMWLERYFIVFTGPSHGYTASRWQSTPPQLWDLLGLFGSLGLFFTLLLLFVRFLPAISIYEVRELVEQQQEQEGRE